MKVDKDGHSYFASLEIKNVTIEDAGKYKVTAKNELGESNATISLNFDSKCFRAASNMACLLQCRLALVISFLLTCMF